MQLFLPPKGKITASKIARKERMSPDDKSRDFSSDFCFLSAFSPTYPGVPDKVETLSSTEVDRHMLYCHTLTVFYSSQPGQPQMPTWTVIPVPQRLLSGDTAKYSQSSALQQIRSRHLSSNIYHRRQLHHHI